VHDVAVGGEAGAGWGGDGWVGAVLKLRVHFQSGEAGEKVLTLSISCPCGRAGRWARGVACPFHVSSRFGMQALVLLLWTGALLGQGSCQNVDSSHEVSGGRWVGASAVPAPY
jgi:hypothetical protein